MLDQRQQEGELGQAGQIPPAPAPVALSMGFNQPTGPVVFIHDVQTGQETVGMRVPGLHSYVYHNAGKA